jgi:hypothetical protein
MRKSYFTICIMVIFILCITGAVIITHYVYYTDLPDEYKARLQAYAQATTRYFTSSLSNNTNIGFTHSFFGTGRFQVLDEKVWREENWDLTRGYGSHVNINEVTLGFLCLAAAYKMNWLTYLSIGERYAKSWGQILRGLQTIEHMQTSGNTLQFHNGHFHRTYLTAIERDGLLDTDRKVNDIISPININIQSSDDNALPFMNLCILEGLAKDNSVEIPERRLIISLCQKIRSLMNLRGFVLNSRIVHYFENGTESNDYWDRISTEGPIILSAILLSGQIDISEFYAISKSFRNSSANIYVNFGQSTYAHRLSYHSAIFMHGLRIIHGFPTTKEEYHPGCYFQNSFLPIIMSHVHYADLHGFKILGSQAMTQTLNGTPIYMRNNKQVQFPGNEDGVVPVYGYNLSTASSSHAWFVPLSRWKYLPKGIIDRIFRWMTEYETEFFHFGSDVDLGWEVVIPWMPSDKNFAWRSSDNRWNFSDWGRPYEALNSAYIIISIFDALNQDKPISSYHIFQDQLKEIASYIDDRK